MTSTAPNRSRRTTRVSGDDRQRAILATAERLLDEADFADLSVDDLARGAGISRPTFYFYFASKQAVLLALLDQVAAEAEARSADVFDDLAADPAKAWRRAIEAFAQTFAAHRGVSVAAAAARASEPELAAQWARLMGRWIDATAAAITSERDRGVAIGGPDAHGLAVALNLLNENVITTALTAPGAAVGVDTVDTLVHVWWHSIYGTHPDA